MMALIRRSYKFLDTEIFKLLYKSLVRSHLEYARSVWCPYKIKHIDAIENVQRRATKQIPGYSNLTYEQRLQKLKLPTLKFRRIRGDMIETFKIMSKVYDPDVAPDLRLCNNTSHDTRGHKFKLQKQQCAKSLRLNSFPLRINEVWNKLPQSVVDAPSVNAFKNRLDKFWEKQELLYDYKASINLLTGKSNFRIDEEDLVIEV